MTQQVEELQTVLATLLFAGDQAPLPYPFKQPDENILNSSIKLNALEQRSTPHNLPHIAPADPHYNSFLPG